LTLAGLRLTAGTAPLAASVSVVGVFGRFESSTRLALASPGAAGVQMSVTVSLPPGARVVPARSGEVIAHSAACAPLRLAPEKVSGPLPALVRMTLRWLLGTPTGTWVLSDPVQSTRRRGWVPVSPAASFDQSEAPASLIARTRYW